MFKSKNHISTERPLELLHIDLFGLINKRLSGNRYVFVMVDDFTIYIYIYIYIWVLFLKSKDKSIFEICKVFKECWKWKVFFHYKHGSEFISDLFESFCEEKGYHHNFSTPKTPQQNGVVERKNRSLQ